MGPEGVKWEGNRLLYLGLGWVTAQALGGGEGLEDMKVWPFEVPDFLHWQRC